MATIIITLENDETDEWVTLEFTLIRSSITNVKSSVGDPAKRVTLPDGRSVPFKRIEVFDGSYVSDLGVECPAYSGALYALGHQYKNGKRDFLFILDSASGSLGSPYGKPVAFAASCGVMFAIDAEELDKLAPIAPWVIAECRVEGSLDLK